MEGLSSSGNGADLGSPRAGERLLKVGLRSGATDVVITPGNEVGNLHLRSNFQSIYSVQAPMEAIESLSSQFLEMASLPSEIPMLGTRIGSFGYSGARVRVSYTRTENGPLIRLRIQSRGVLDEARAEFLKGKYGGTDVLPFLKLPRGLLVVTGLASAGKTSALAHLTSQLRGRPVVVAEAVELPGELERVDPCGRSVDELVLALGSTAPRPLVIDEMDEGEKLTLAARTASSRLVLASLSAPNLAAAVRKYAAQGLSTRVVLGFLRADWKELESGGRVPSYTWFPLGEGKLGHCPICGHRREKTGHCPGCGLPPVARFLDRAVLRSMNTPEGFRALDRLEQEWHF
ncbi:MAG: hypothetical protein HY319_19565 [Armatimonadetes bacterium]|nr:hypothetical protein [Armatimonadota bacterium]